MDLESYAGLRLERAGKVLTVTLNRPDTLNAIGPEIEGNLIRVLGDAAVDPATAVVVLTGAGRAFSAGGNIPDMQKMIDHPGAFMDGAHRAKQLVFQLLDFPKPIIAKVNGHAIGLGATLALFCDIVF